MDMAIDELIHYTKTNTSYNKSRNLNTITLSNESWTPSVCEHEHLWGIGVHKHPNPFNACTTSPDQTIVNQI